jgi:restriction endonuclease
MKKLPMSKMSTLIYFINYFQADFLSSFLGEINDNSWNELTKTEETEIAPSEQAINNILNFARSYEVLKTAHAGYVETILN